jgi:enamine deaminase RidA (YjgF/YER057c/UK114 family)
VEAIADALAELDAGTEGVIRARMYVRDAEDWPEVGRVQAEVFGEAKPATTLVEVEGFVDEVLPVEVEAEAVATG